MHFPALRLEPPHDRQMERPEMDVNGGDEEDFGHVVSTDYTDYAEFCPLKGAKMEQKKPLNREPSVIHESHEFSRMWG